ncbi:MAG: hypothetical protein E6Q88_03685 [Lysobacteraceae bacterium]|nr:MAG: hypothetical protein E6Q88_03685 [Xanthomonadaceae bacterium]
MDLSTQLFEKPRFRPGVAVKADAGRIEIEYRDQGCDIEMSGYAREDVESLMDSLRRGDADMATLRQRHAIDAEELDGILLEFDRLGLLTEGSPMASHGQLTGEAFHFKRLMPTIRSVHARLGDSPLYGRMLSGQVTRNELIGFALEYYHLVHMAPGLISPSISHIGNARIRSELIKLFVEEHNHDKMMIRSLAAVGISEDVLQKRVPLPTTFSAYASLGVYARQHILSFFSALFLFESPSHDFNAVFLDTCRRLGLPEGFYKPIIRHSDINEEGNHDAATQILLSQVPVISEQEQTTILIHITALVEMLHKQDAQIVEYYGREDCDLMRVY